MAAGDSVFRFHRLKQLEAAAWDPCYDLEPESDLEVEDYDSIIEEEETPKKPSKIGFAKPKTPLQLKSCELLDRLPKRGDEKASESMRMDFARANLADYYHKDDEHTSFPYAHRYCGPIQVEDKKLLDWMTVKQKTVPPLIQEFRRSVKAHAEKLEIDAMKKSTLESKEEAKKWKLDRNRPGCEATSRIRNMDTEKANSKPMHNFLRKNAVSTSWYEEISEAILSSGVEEVADRFQDIRCTEDGCKQEFADPDECDFFSHGEDEPEEDQHPEVFVKDVSQ